jgi:hypothetical protein
MPEGSKSISKAFGMDFKASGFGKNWNYSITPDVTGDIGLQSLRLWKN